MKVLIFGITGMLGNAMFRFLDADKNLKVYGTARNEDAHKFFPQANMEQILTGIDVEKHDSLTGVFARLRPDIVINCVGLVKQLAQAENPLHALPLNAMLPHRLALLCEAGGARLIHISTDCVFSGKKGNYTESDFPDAYDLYGRSKLLGEVNYPHAVTLRTSIIGHEMVGQRSLLDWFLAQTGTAKGFRRAIFSGLPTVELARVVHDYVLPRTDLSGVFHVAAKPINKFDLLTEIAKVYEKQIEIIADDHLVIDRSLNADRFNKATGYRAPEWPQLLHNLRAFYRT